MSQSRSKKTHLRLLTQLFHGIPPSHAAKIVRFLLGFITVTKKKTGQEQEDFTRPTAAHARAHKGPRAGRIVSILLIAILGFGASAVWAVQDRINSSVTKLNTKDLVSKPEMPKDPAAGESLNILVMGTDTREGGDNSDLVGDTVGGARSDTTMIMHISSDRSRVEVISIPRDTMVEIPECKLADGKTIPAASNAMFNSAFSRGWDYGGDYVYAAACTQETVQQITGLTIDHTVIVNFEGFVGMVDALGGINIDIPEDITTRKAGGLKLKAGEQTLSGKQALNLVRARKGTGWGLEIGSDLKRIERQQAVLQATVETALSKNMLTDLTKLTSFVTASLSSLMVDEDFGADNMIALAWSAKSLRLDDVKFYSAPVQDDPNNRYKVIFIDSEAEEMWAKLRKDEPIEPVETTDCSTTDTDATDSTADPSGDSTQDPASCSTSTDSETASN